MDKLEEVARALAVESLGPESPWDDLPQIVRAIYFDRCRVVIAALMDPSEAMYVAYIENTENTGIVPAEGRAILAAAKSDWQAMLKAAMEEDK
jgi:hypothetical protein